MELLGETYCFPTTISYDGTIANGVLNGNIYIQGHGDPTLGSSHFAPESETFIKEWKDAIRQQGIREIKGAIIADESIFDNEGISMKWLREDLGSYYGAGSYGLSFHDNLYSLYLNSGATGTRPTLVRTEPEMDLDFHNYLKAAATKSDSSFIVGMPFSNERYLYGIVPANRQSYRLKGDIPDPALFFSPIYTERIGKRWYFCAEGSNLLSTSVRKECLETGETDGNYYDLFPDTTTNRGKDQSCKS